jgi:hypothetical protein
MKEQIISFETAKLAEEKGYKLDKWFNGIDITINLPTQSLLQKWLRDNQKIMVWCFPNARDESDYVLWQYQVFNNQDRGRVFATEKDTTYEKALEKGLQIALELI